jgi:hypothetical protein
MDGVNTPGKAEITTQDDLDIFTNVRGKNVDLTSTERSVRVGSKVVRQHHGENYTDTLVKTEIVAEEDLNVNAKIDAEFHGAKTHSGVRTKIKAKTGGVFDQAVATETHRVTHSHSKNSSTTTKYTHVHQNVNEHSSDGIVDIEAETVVAQQGTINRNVQQLFKNLRMIRLLSKASRLLTKRVVLGVGLAFQSAKPTITVQLLQPQEVVIMGVKVSLGKPSRKLKQLPQPLVRRKVILRLQRLRLTLGSTKVNLKTYQSSKV